VSSLRSLVFFVVATLVLAGSGARATDLHDKPPPWEGAQTWYGWQTLSADGAALLLGGVGAVRLATDDAYANQGSNGLAGTGLRAGLVVFALGTPLMHGLHRHPARAVGSLAMRVLLPLLGAFAFGNGGCSGSREICFAAGAGANAGALGGALLAIGVDAAQAWDIAPPSSPADNAVVVLTNRSAGLWVRF